MIESQIDYKEVVFPCISNFLISMLDRSSIQVLTVKMKMCEH